MTRKIDFTAFYLGSMYVPFDVAMSMQKYLAENLITAIVDDKEYNQTEDIRPFNYLWPTCNYPFQTYNSYGQGLLIFRNTL